MIILRFTDQYPYAGPYELDVPHYPYHLTAFVQDGIMARIAIVPLEWSRTQEALQAFLKKIPSKFISGGIGKLEIVQDDKVLSVWKHPLILPYRTKDGIGVEIESLLKDVQNA